MPYWKATDDLAAYEELAGAFLRAAAVEHTLLLTQLERLRARTPEAPHLAASLLALRTSDGDVVGAAVHIDGGPLALGTMASGAAAALADAIDRPVVAVAGRVADVEALVPRLEAFGRGRARSRRHDVLMRLEALEEPVPPAGRALVASHAERRVAVDLVAAFMAEVGEDASRAAGAVDDRLAHGGITLWYDEAGRASALAGLNRVVAGTARIGPVYTDPAARGRGLGAAVTCAVARQALGAGATDVLLFADRANATSTALYARLGFAARAEHLVVDLD